ncbi:MAG: N-6 DNA methylase [Syntrophales bacterium]|nr:N-6 DNA methylase [Syntrophales bacterium]
MQTRRVNLFTTIRTEGGLLPADLLQRIADGDGDIEGLKPADYHLYPGEKLNEAINRSWNRLTGAWKSFKNALEKLSETDTGTTETRERWLLPLFQELGYGRLQTTKALNIEGKSYPISHTWQNTPIHLVGCRLDLDRRTPGAIGAARTSPHSLGQEFLNRSDDHLWAFLSNGLLLRILRDNVSLTRQAYVEFDLETIMDGEVYADFAVLWLVCHQSRVESERPEQCRLEKWCQHAQDRGARALDTLHSGVENAIKALGHGFLSCPGNRILKDKLRSGELDKQDYYRQLLRFIYRMLFLFVAEDRELLLDPKANADAKERYVSYYSTSRLRQMAERKRGTKHADLGRMLLLVFEKLGDKNGCPELGLPALGSLLWSRDAIADLIDCDISNLDLLEAVRHLVFIVDNGVRRPVDYKNLGSEELGSIYESLLEMHPDLSIESGTFDLKIAAGHERKSTGSYYTPSSLINCLLDSALDPVLDEAAKKDDPEQAILNLKVCDPATGSGHFLVAAAHRIARRLAAVRTGDEEPAPEAVRHALRDVIGRCLYGVDINPMAVELCKVSLWMESLEPGKPLSFLDHHIQCGNSLLGTTPALLKKGIPDDVFKPIEGDEKEFCTKYRKINRDERKGQTSLWSVREDQKPWNQMAEYAADIEQLNAVDDSTIHGISERHAQYEKIVKSQDYKSSKLLADAWCAAFVWKKKKEPNLPYPITEEIFRRIEKEPNSIPEWMKEEIRRLSDQYQYFHWHLAFPDVFHIPDRNEELESEQLHWSGGFDVVLGNPPWEKITTLEREFFASMPEISEEKRSDRRRRMILELSSSDPELFDQWLNQKRYDVSYAHFLKSSGLFPLSSVGELNLYPLFVEISDCIIDRSGAAGLVIKTGMMLSPTWAKFSSYLIEHDRIESAFDFRNWKGWFPDIGYHERFTLLTMKKGRQKQNIFLGYYLDDPAEIKDVSKTFTISRDEAIHLNPITKTVPAFESSRHKTCVMAVYDRFPVLNDDSSEWGVHYTTGLHMAAEADKLRDFEELSSEGFELDEFLRMKKGEHTFIPLYEGKFIQQFDHRFASFEGIPREKRFGIKAGTHNPTEEQKGNPAYHITPRYWISDENAASDREARHLRSSWAITFRDTTNVISNFRTSVACICAGVAFNYKAPNIVLEGPSESDRAKKSLLFVTMMNAFPFDYVVRQKFFGANFIKSILLQLAAPSMGVIHSHQSFILPRALELFYTSWQLEGFAAECGYNGNPFTWDEIRRQQIRAELDALFFYVYGFSIDHVAFILDSYRILRDKDEDRFGEYRTKRLILEIYDDLAEAIRIGKPYQTRIDPLPADPRVAHLPSEEIMEAVIIDPSFPRTETQRVLCAATLELVRTASDMPNGMYLDALYLATHPDHCEVLLTNTENSKFRIVASKVTQLLFLSKGQLMGWKQIRDYLEMVGAIRIADRQGAQRLSEGPNYMNTRNKLPHGLDAIVPFALRAAEELIVARADTHARARIPNNVFEEINREISRDQAMSI